MRLLGRSSRAIRSFTLVELRVVVSIIALLLSILQPSMSRARDQAKIVKCQANMRSINTALLTYVAEFDTFPLVLPPNMPNGCLCTWCSWTYGGWLGKNPYWKTAHGGCRQIPASRRPLTLYMNKGTVTPPVQTGSGPRDIEEITGQPVFKCPSDTVSAQWQWGYLVSGRRADNTYSAYDDVGTSYQMNFFGWSQTHLLEGVDHDGDGVVEPTLGLCAPDLTVCCTYGPCERWPGRVDQVHQVWRRFIQGDASRLVTIDEDPFDFAVYVGTRELGFHRQFSWHNLAFLDGHVAYLMPDTRRPWGTEWTVIDEELEYNWPPR